MIKINLLIPYKEAAHLGGLDQSSSDDENNQLYIAFAKRILILAIGPLGFYFYEGQIIPDLEAKLAELSQKTDELRQFNDSKQGLTEEIKKYEAEQARFNAQMDFINKIDHDKVNEYKLFEHLKTSTPSTVWINKLDLMGNALSISAESDNQQDISTFIERLSSADFIKNLIPLNQTIKLNYAETDATTIIFTLQAELVSGKTP